MIEITPEMLSAGVQALACYGSDDELETAVWAVLQAALLAAEAGPEEDRSGESPEG